MRDFKELILTNQTTLSYIVCRSRDSSDRAASPEGAQEDIMAMGETYRTWREFEQIENRKIGTFQLCIDDLAKDLYIDILSEKDDAESEELNFDHF